MASSFLEKYVKAGHTSISNLLLHHYHEIGMTTAELMVYLELRSYIDRGENDPAVSQIAQNLGATEEQVYDLINQMVNDHLMEQKMKKTSDGKESAYYDFSAMLHKLERLAEAGFSKQAAAQSKNQRQELFSMIETEFGRMLNPIEISLVNDWIDKDHYDLGVIKLALKETVLNGKYNFKYMDRILSNWDNNNLRTPQAVEADMKRFDEKRQYNNSGNNQIKASGKKIPIFKMDSLKKKK